MVELRAFIFDVDGTLADTERDGHRLAFNRAFIESGLSWEWSVELYGELLAVTGGKERIQHYIERYSPKFPAPADVKAFIAQLHAAKTKSYTQLLAEGAIPLRPGVKRLLQEARQRGIRLAIATTTTPANVTALLENTLQPEGSGWFEVIAAGDIVPQKKPAADIYYYALQQLGLEARECLAFEDSFNGLVSALKAGIQTVITVNEYTQTQDFSGASLVLDHLGEPMMPFHVLSGKADGSTHFTVELAQVLHQQRF